MQTGQDFIKLLLRALDEPAIRDKVLEIESSRKKPDTCDYQGQEENGASKNFDQVETEKIQELQTQLSEYKEKCNRKEKLLQEKATQCVALEKENRELSTKLNKSFEQIQDEHKEAEQTAVKLKDIECKAAELESNISEFVGAYGELDNVYKQFCLLPEETRESLRTVLNSKDPVTFLTFGSQFCNIESLWGYLKSDYIKLSEEQRNILLECMRFFIGRINKLYQSDLYQLISDPVGTPFDSLRHSKGEGCSSYQGNIGEVLLPGIWNTQKKQFVRKSVVLY